MNSSSTVLAQQQQQPTSASTSQLQIEEKIYKKEKQILFEFDLKSGTKVENRIYQQYLFKNKIGSNTFTHRFRLEERFFPNEFGLRTRYFIALLKPLGNKNFTRKTTYFSAYNELFVDIKEAKFDRNRLYAGLGIGINESIRVETGYMIQAQKNITRGQLQFILYNNLPFKKQNNKKV
jgi:hypothetical protein